MKWKIFSTLTLMCYFLSACAVYYGNIPEYDGYSNIAKVHLMDTLYNDDYTFYNNTAGTGLIPELLGIADIDENGDGVIDKYGYNTYLRSLSAKKDLPEVVIAVLDSGVNAGHKKFQQRILYQYARNYITGNTKDIRDVLGHGTHVAGIICDLTLENVKILPIRIFDKSEIANGLTIQSAVEYIINIKQNYGLNIVAVNMSLGTGPEDINTSGYAATLGWYQNIVNRLLRNNILPFVANGNGEKDAHGNQIGSSAPSIPAVCSGVVAVSAFDAYTYSNNPNNMSLARFSNYGSHTDISAPGTYSSSGITSAGAGYDGTALSAGTSMATPFVTAAYALLCSAAADWADFLEKQGSSWVDTIDKNVYHYLNPIHKALLFSAIDFNIQTDGQIIENNIDSDGDGKFDKDEYFGHGCVSLSKFLEYELKPDFVPPDFEVKPEIVEDKVFIKLNIVGGGSIVYGDSIFPMQFYIHIGESGSFNFEPAFMASYGYKFTSLSITNGDRTTPLDIGGEYDYTSTLFYTFDENACEGGKEYTVNAAFTEYDIPREDRETIPPGGYDLSNIIWYVLGFGVFAIIIYAVRACFWKKPAPMSIEDILKDNTFK